MNKIAILDFHEQDPGLKILFPESDYYVFMKGYDRYEIYSKHNIDAKYHDQQLNVFDKIKLFNSISDNTYRKFPESLFSKYGIDSYVGYRLVELLLK